MFQKLPMPVWASPFKEGWRMPVQALKYFAMAAIGTGVVGSVVVMDQGVDQTLRLLDRDTKVYVSDFLQVAMVRRQGKYI